MAITTPVSFWKFDESSGNASDAVGSNTLTNNGTTPYVTGKINNGADLESGSSQYFSITDGSQSGLDLTGNYSFSIWVNLESQPATNSDRPLLIKYDPTGNQRGYYIAYQDSGGTKRFESRISTDGTGVATTIKTLNYTLSTATWTHLVFAFTASTGTMEVFVDGSSIGSMTGHGTSIFNNTAAFRIGANDDATIFFDGIIDAVGIWNVVLSGSEITELFNSGTGSQYPFTVTETFTPKAIIF
jgi:hypothetical protein